jgi:hypothetical protein
MNDGYIYYRRDLNRKPYLILSQHERNWKYNNTTKFLCNPKEIKKSKFFF